MGITAKRKQVLRLANIQMPNSVNARFCEVLSPTRKPLTITFNSTTVAT